MRSFWVTVKHYWQIHLIVALCTAVATGVLVGAMIVGDSMRGSLLNLTLERLGNIHQALIAENFFNPEKINRQDTVPAILLNGTVVASETDSRASTVNIYGIQNNFFGLWNDGVAPNINHLSNNTFANVVINETLQRELNVKIGDEIIVNFSQVTDIHPDFLLGDRDTSNNIKKLRLVISYILPTENAGRFSLHANQNLPLNLYISLPILQKALMQTGKVNVLFTSSTEPISTNKLVTSLEDLELYLNMHETHMDLQSKKFLIDSGYTEKIITVAAENNIPFIPTLTYLANTITTEDISHLDVDRNNIQMIPYSTILALPIETGEIDKLVDNYITEEERLLAKSKIESHNKSITPTSIILNSWAADVLNVNIGDNIFITYFSVGVEENYTIKSAEFILTGIVPIMSIAADTNIIPAFPGIQDTLDITEWEPPFPIDYSLIHDVDEEYWDEYKTTPKAFLDLDTGKQLWENRFGDLTTVRMQTAPELDIEATKVLFETEFLKKIIPEQIGYQMIDLREDGLNASKGSTDFGMLFSSLSGFIIIAVAILIGIVFRIGTEQRAREIGILQAVGYTLAKIRQRLLFEGVFIACFGGFLGCFLAIGYANLMIFGLKTWWLPAIGTPFLNLHVNPLSLIIGTFISLIVVTFSIYFTVSRLGKKSTVSLLTGKTNLVDVLDAPKINNNIKTHLLKNAILFITSGFISGYLTEGELFSKGWIVIIILTFLSISYILSIGKVGSENRVMNTKQKSLIGITYSLLLCIGFGVGASLRYIPFLNGVSTKVFTFIDNPVAKFLMLTISVLCLGWVIFGKWLRSQNIMHRINKAQFALKNAARQPERSLASVITISLACCIVVAVGANRHDALPETEWTFVAESSLPVYHNLNTQIGRLELGFDETDSQLLASTKIIPFRVLPGEDVSCLNLYKPKKPQVLGASINFQNEEPWNTLNSDSEQNARIHAIGDENSLRWILQHNPKDDFLIQDEFGNNLFLNLGTVKNSIFQSQLIISESNFTKYFPSQSGYKFFLIKTPPELQTEIRSILENTLVDYGLDVTLAAERLANFRAVENTYISTFQSLGGLGVLLGTFGLALILFRNIIERRGELATLRAFGFRRKVLSYILFFESCFILTVGMFIGIITGLIAILGSQGNLPTFPWVSLALTLFFILTFGIIANCIAVYVSLRSPLLSTLKSD